MRRIACGLAIAASVSGSLSAMASPSHSLFLLAPESALAIPAGSELCGIDSIFYDGFDPASFIPIERAPGGISSPGLIADILGSGTLSVVIVSPTAGATISDSTIDVAGTFSGPVNTGITVNNIAGYTVNGHFLVPGVALNPGGNTLMIEATTLPGATATTSISVTQGGSPSPVILRSDRSIGYAPVVLNFNYDVGPLPDHATVQSIAVNFKGSGTDDYSGPPGAASMQYIYSQPGIYSARLTVTDSKLRTYIAYRQVLIQDLDAQRGMLCDVYGYLRTRLLAKDAAGAGNAFQPVQRTGYVDFFTKLGMGMPAAAQQLGVIVAGELGLGFADLLLVRDDAAAKIRSGFPLRLTQGTDGVWRISEM